MSHIVRSCDGISRRDALGIGVAGLLGSSISLPDILLRQSLAAENGRAAKEVSLIIVFLRGGMSIIDTLDLKPDAPAEIRGEFRPIDTNVPGIQIGEHLPLLARQADKFSLLRSMTNRSSSHGVADHYMLTGYHPSPAFDANLKPNNQRPSHGSIIARKLGPKGSVPPYVCVPRLHNSGGGAYLGSAASPFIVNADPNSPAFSVPDLVPPPVIGASRLDARQRLLRTVDRYKRTAEIRANHGARALSVFQEKAFDLITSAEATAAFDIGQEPKKLRDEYGRHTLGQCCLMARRLVEAGVRCVTIMHNDWDTHYNNFHVLKNDLLPKVNTGLTVLLRDLADRGLLESTLVVAMGEFGRTPRINKNSGRDHWGPSSTILLGGGGVQGGRVVGKTNAHGERPAADPTGPEDLAATIYRCIGIDSDEQFYTPEGRPVKIVNDGRTISDLL